jgi:SSS family solute:Na+ symporter
VINVIVAAVLTAVLRALKAPEGDDVTLPEDYRADQGDPRVRDQVRNQPEIIL